MACSSRPSVADHPGSLGGERLVAVRADQRGAAPQIGRRRCPCCSKYHRDAWRVPRVLQWLIIQGRLVGNALLPFAPTSVALRLRSDADGVLAARNITVMHGVFLVSFSG